MDFELVDKLQTLGLLGRVASCIQLPECGGHLGFWGYLVSAFGVARLNLTKRLWKSTLDKDTIVRSPGWPSICQKDEETHSKAEQLIQGVHVLL